MSRAMRPPVRHRPVFSSAQFASLADQHGPRRERRRDQKKRDHHPQVCLSPVRHVISERNAVDAAWYMCRRNVGTRS